MQQRPLREMLGRWVPAYSRALMCHLRKGEDLGTELQVGPAGGSVHVGAESGRVWRELRPAGTRGPSMSSRRRPLTVSAHRPPPSLQGILLPHEITAVLGAVHRPNYVLQARAAAS